MTRFTNVYFDGQRESGAYIQGDMVSVPVDYTMNKLVTAIKEAGYISFKTESMKTLVRI